MSGCKWLIDYMILYNNLRNFQHELHVLISWECINIFKSVKLVAYFIRINRKIPLNYNYTCTNVLQSTIFFLVWFVLQNLFRALSNSNCKIDCSRKKNRPVCGSDGVTYKHRCELKRAKRCDKKKVKVKRKGPCSRE